MHKKTHQIKLEWWNKIRSYKIRCIRYFTWKMWFPWFCCSSNFRFVTYPAQVSSTQLEAFTCTTNRKTCTHRFLFLHTPTQACNRGPELLFAHKWRWRYCLFDILPSIIETELPARGPTLFPRCGFGGLYLVIDGLLASGHQHQHDMTDSRQSMGWCLGCQSTLTPATSSSSALTLDD